VESQSQDLVQTISLVALAVIGLIVGVQKLLKDWRSTQAETNIIQLMHTEIERMGEQNSKLSVELGKLQEEVIRLNQELSKLNIENSKLQEEIAQLTLELTRFKQNSRGAR
jgi:septal ring factor EnvC (AmiA/AmiB activator)